MIGAVFEFVEGDRDKKILAFANETACFTVRDCAEAVGADKRLVNRKLKTMEKAGILDARMESRETATGRKEVKVFSLVNRGGPA